MRKRSGGVRTIKGHRYMRIRVGDNRRETVPLPGCRTEDEATARCEIIADVVNELVAGGRRDKVRDVAVQLGAASGDKRVDRIRKYVTELLRAERVAPDAITVRQFAEQWTSGRLHDLYPDHVKKKASASDDEGRLRRYILPLVGDLPLASFQLADAEAVMRAVPRERAGATRRHVAQLLSRLFRMAVYPAGVIKVSPLPPGFLPKLGKGRALQYVYPSEDAKLLACRDVPVAYRIAYGVLAREGMRLSEIVGRGPSIAGREKSKSRKAAVDPIAWLAARAQFAYRGGR